jgi:peroxiredoxin
MSLTPSTMLPLGTKAPDFALKDTEGNQVSLSDFSDKKALVVMFICNHCPYVKHVRRGIVELADDYMDRDVGFVAINSNDAEMYPDDDYESMKKEVAEVNYQFPYLHDETQKVAHAYKAACTPDFFVFDGNMELIYRGQFDNSRPSNNIPVTGKSIRGTLDAVLSGEPVSENQKPSVGCNIKWKRGNEPDYF